MTTNQTNTTTKTNTTTALQVTDFNFYGDELIALKDNATGEIYTAINHVLRGIGFTDKQIEHQQKKILSDSLFQSHTLKFSGVDLNMPSVNEIWCISQKKLPLALAKINITPSMKKNQPELSDRLLKYQDKCADVLASVFIGHQSTDQVYMQQCIQPILDTLTTITQSLNATNNTLLSMNDRMTKLEEAQAQQKFIPKKRFSYWASKMYPKYQLLMDYFNISNKELYKHLFWELQNTYPDIELNQIVDDYCYENKLENCFTLDAIEHDKAVRTLFEGIVDGLIEKYNLSSDTHPVTYKTIFE